MLRGNTYDYRTYIYTRQGTNLVLRPQPFHSKEAHRVHAKDREQEPQVIPSDIRHCDPFQGINDYPKRLPWIHTSGVERTKKEREDDPDTRQLLSHPKEAEEAERVEPTELKNLLVGGSEGGKDPSEGSVVLLGEG
jgi:hypothetical protein